MEKQEIKTSPKVVNYFGELLLDADLPAEARGKFLDYMNRDAKNQPAEFVFEPGYVQQKVRGLVQMMLSMPHYQLC